jgi:hypothetical protein
MGKSSTSQICNDALCNKFEASVSSQFLVNPELGHSSGLPAIPPSTIQASTIQVSVYAHKFDSDEEMMMRRSKQCLE